eukprot:260057_1
MDLKFCTSQEDGEICGHLKCASGFKKASRSEYPRLTCAVKNNSWSMTGTTCIPRTECDVPTATDLSPQLNYDTVGLKKCTNIQDGGICSTLKCASGHKKATDG